MNLSELRYIVALARERHFGRAAAACHVSQPTLSVAVKKLEAELDLALFERGTQEVHVTQAGKRVVEQAQRALEAFQAVRQVAETESDQLSHRLHIGAIYTVGPYLFPDLIGNLRKLAPQMPLIAEENYTGVLREKLKQGALDVAIISLPFSEPGMLTAPVYEEPFVVLLPPDHPLAGKKFLRPEYLEGETILMLGAGHCFRDQVIEACPACAPSATAKNNAVITVEGSSLETIRHMVASGLGLTVLPSTAAGVDRYSRDLLIVKPFVKPSPGRKVALAWRAGFPRPKVIDVLREAITGSLARGAQEIG